MPLTKIQSLGITDGTILGADINSTFDLTGKTVTLPAGTGGKVLQVVSATYNTQQTTTSDTHVTSNLTVSITPSSSSNKILILASAVIANDNNNCHIGVTLYRGATNLSNDTDMAHSYGSAAGSVRSNIGLNYLDSPSTTSSTTYTVYFRAGLSGNTQYIHINDSMSVITAIEIAG